MKSKMLVAALIIILVLPMTACGSSGNSDGNNTQTESSSSEGKKKASTADGTKGNASAGADNKADASENSVIGYYKLTKMIMDGEDLSEELGQLADVGSGVFAIVNPDGTGKMNFIGEITEFDWDEKQFHMHDETATDTDVNYTYADDTLTIADDGQEMQFVRMSEEEKKAYDSGDYDKTADQIADDMLDQALEDATGELDNAFEEATGALDETAKEAGEAAYDAIDDADNIISEATKEAGDEIDQATEEALAEITDATEEAKDAITGSISGSLSGSSKSNSKEETTGKTDSSYLPDLSASKHNDTGYYEIMAFQEDGKTYTAADLKNAGVEFDMMLCPDGKGYAHFIGAYYDLSWDDGTIYVATDEEQEKMIYFKSDYDGKSIITINDSSIAMVFEYVKEADDTYEWTGVSGVRQ